LNVRVPELESILALSKMY